MEQKKIAKEMKALIAIIAVIGIVVFAALFKYSLEYYSFKTPMEYLFLSKWPVVLTIAVSIVLCYLDLFYFWRICTQIGNENSFSKENTHNLKRMSRLTFILAAVWLIFSICYSIWHMGLFSPAMTIKPYVIAMLCAVMGAVFDVLAKLVESARRIREENELTI